MASIEKIENELNDAKARFGEATKDLKEWEEGEYKGVMLNDLRVKLNNGEYRDEKQEKRWEDSVKELKKEKEGLEESKERWEKQVVKLQDALVALRGGEGNEQIA